MSAPAPDGLRRDEDGVDHPLPERIYVPDELDLFLFSAATWNSHRIHYDLQYARAVEGHEGLVVQGPLQGTYLTHVVRAWLGDRGRISAVSFRHHRPVVAGTRLTCKGVAHGPADLRGAGTVACRVWAETDEGVVTTSGSVTVEIR